MAEIHRVFWRHNVSSGFELMTLKELRRIKTKLNHRLTDTQRLDFHLLLLTEEGEGAHMVDFETHACRRGTLIHVSPNQIHAFADSVNYEGCLLLFRPEFLPTDFYGPESRVSPPAECVWPSVTQLNSASMDFASTGFGFLREQQTSKGVWRLPEACRHIAIGLTSFAYRTAASNNNALLKTHSQPLYFGFLTLLEQHYPTRRDAKWYAARLDCSYRNLCRVCKLASGKTPKAAIDHRVGIEARRRLAFTGESAAEVGAMLGFTEPTNFVKFFQRVVGETPDAFRRHWHG